MNVSTEIPVSSFSRSGSSSSDSSQSDLAQSGSSQPSLTVEQPSPPSSLLKERQVTVPSPKPTLRQEIQIFSSTFLAILLAEIGDKTQVATLLMSAGTADPWVVFAGSAIALIATSLIGVLVGRWLATKISPRTLETGAGALLLLISVLLLWDVVHL